MPDQVRIKLIETGGRISQDLGTGRIVGQVLVYLYLQERESSLDVIGEELGLSKASISIAARQLEQMGLVRKVWRAGDRRNYLRSADNIGTAIQHGLVALVQQKVQLFGRELDEALVMLEQERDGGTDHRDDNLFLESRVNRAKKLQTRLAFILDNPLLQLFTGSKEKA